MLKHAAFNYLLIISITALLYLQPISSWTFNNRYTRVRDTHRLSMASARVEGFTSKSEYIAHLETVAALPAGFSVGLTDFKFSPVEVAAKILPMRLTVITLDSPSTAFAALFTSNKCPGAPVIVGKNRMLESSLQTIVINNKI